MRLKFIRNSQHSHEIRILASHMTLKDLKIQYLEYLEIEKNRSQKTLENYGRYLNRFFAFANVSSPAQIDDELVRQYRLYLNRRGQVLSSKVPDPLRPLKKVTQNYHIIALRNFLKYLAKRDIKSLPAEKVELGKQEQREVTFLEPEELERLLDSPGGDNLDALRDRALLATLFSTGMRVSELCSLDRDKIDIKRGEVTVRGKGSKLRLVFLSDNAKDTLNKYLDKRTDIDEALFARIPRGMIEVRPQDNKRSDLSTLRLTPRSIQRIVEKHAIKAGIVGKNVSPHSLRHCLHKETRVFLDQEICSALTLFQNRNTFAKSMDFKGGILKDQKVVQKFSHITEELVKIQADGHELICTPKHRLFTIDKEGVSEIEARNVKLGTHLAGIRHVFQRGRKFLPAYVWRVIGYILGYGIISERNKGVHVYDKNVDFLRHYQKLIKKRTHKEPFVRSYRTGKSFVLNYYSLDFIKFLRNFIPPGIAKYKRVPPQLFQATDREIQHFIAGFYDAEGNSGTIKIFSASKELLKNIQALLIRLGIDRDRKS